MLLYPGLTQLDLTGPYEVFARIEGARVHLIWKTLDPVRADSGLTLIPTATFATAPQPDVLFAPGGPGQAALMDDAETLGFLARAGAGARYVTSVCTGSLILAAAGLLQGRRAACHWLWRGELARFGIEVRTERVVVDGNRITGGGVTAGIDAALALLAEVASPQEAHRIQLQIIPDRPRRPTPTPSPRSNGAARRCEKSGTNRQAGRWPACRKSRSSLGRGGARVITKLHRDRPFRR